jgi:UDP-glucose 4-epimerase
MRCLVSGGAGFIGSHLVSRLLKNGHYVFVIDNLENGKKTSIPSQAVFLKADVADSKTYKNLPSSIDTVFHLASQASGELSFENPLKDQRVNQTGSLLLANWARFTKVKNFVFTSTMGVYKDKINGAANEQSRTIPSSFYGIHKLASENYFRILADFGCQVTILRLFNVYGPGQHLDNLKQGMVRIYLSYILKNKPVIVRGKLTRYRDFVYIDDVIDGILKSANRKKGKRYEIINLGTGVRTSVKLLIKEIFKATGNQWRNYLIIQRPSTPRDIFGCYAKNHKAKYLLDWSPKTNLKTGISQMVHWCQEDA